MIDEYLWGRVERISPEAPVPVVAIDRETHTLGGAGNVINNLVAMGAGVCAIGTAGTGTAGRMIFEKLEELGVSTQGIISEKARPTTRKTRVIAANQQVLRIDKELIRQITPQTQARLMATVQDQISQVNLVILSDYDKGLVTRSLVAQTAALAGKHGVPVLADPKSMDFSKYAGVSLLTPNKKEAGLAVQMRIDSSWDLARAGEKIMAETGLDRLLITCGKEGMALFEKGQRVHTIASKARQVFDVSGAGDTVISILGLGLAAGAGFYDAAVLANTAAGLVVAKVGTATVTARELAAALDNA
jgi:D-beta-D-heptose 7-phosphate kinase/D-beta-D-heptose 1-phosphate adenosyltransferase